MLNKKKVISKVIVGMVALGMVLPFATGAVTNNVVNDNVAYAAKGDHGVDWSKYQGAYGKWGYAHDKFAIAQIGGTVDGYNCYPQWTYPTQVSQTIAQCKRAHTYIWWQNVTTEWQADQVLNYFLPKVQTPKGSIIALDVESGNQNTQAIQHACDRIKDAGYTPMVYGYKNYLVSHVDLSYLADREQLWLAEYPNYQVTPDPNYNYFPSYKNIGVFQFTSTYVAGGLDGDIDLTGITDNGYKDGGQADKPKTMTPAVKQGIVADNTPKKDITNGYTVKVNYSASRWATGQAIPSWIKGNMYNVIQTNGNKVLLSGVMSWINKSDVEIVATGAPIAQPRQNNNTGYYVVKYGDNLSTIASRLGTSVSHLVSLNGLRNPNLIYVGQMLRVNGGQATYNRVYYVKNGDTLSGIANKLGVSMNTLIAKNGIRNANLIYVGQHLNY